MRLLALTLILSFCLTERAQSHGNTHTENPNQRTTQNYQPSNKSPNAFTVGDEREAPPPPHADTDKRCKEEKEPQRGDNSTGVVIVTVLLVIVGSYQAYISRETMRRSLRAYISVQPFAFPDKDFVRVIPNGIDEVYFSVTNTGQTPAYKVTNWKKWEMATHFEDVTFRDIDVPEAPENRPKAIALHRGDSSKIFHSVIDLTPEELELWTSGKATLYFYGEVTYKDVFRKWHHTRYRYMANSLKNQMAICDEGNEAN